MKNLVLVLATALAFNFVNAQTPAPTDSVKEYLGKYKFPDGSPVTEITVLIENDVLTASSAMGGSELRKTGTDVFEIVAYAGIATFKRNGDGKVVKLMIQVNDLTMEGDKTEGAPLSDIFWRYRK